MENMLELLEQVRGWSNIARKLSFLTRILDAMDGHPRQIRTEELEAASEFSA